MWLLWLSVLCSLCLYIELDMPRAQVYFIISLHLSHLHVIIPIILQGPFHFTRCAPRQLSQSTSNFMMASHVSPFQPSGRLVDYKRSSRCITRRQKKPNDSKSIDLLGQSLWAIKLVVEAISLALAIWVFYWLPQFTKVTYRSHGRTPYFTVHLGRWFKFVYSTKGFDT